MTSDEVQAAEAPGEYLSTTLEVLRQRHIEWVKNQPKESSNGRTKDESRKPSDGAGS